MAFIFGKPKAGVEITAVANVVRRDVGVAVLHIEGDWLVKNRRSPFSKIERFFSVNLDLRRLEFDTSKLGKYDSSLISLLFKCYEYCRQNNIACEIGGLPKGPRSLLELAIAVPEADVTRKGGGGGIIGRLGEYALNAAGSFKAQATFVGEVTIALVKALCGKARYRFSDLLLVMQKSGPEALPIVALISFLVGMILGFVGVVQLAKYGSEIFVADLVGIATVREMGAMMVGVVMSGRTGAAFAADSGTPPTGGNVSFNLRRRSKLVRVRERDFPPGGKGTEGRSMHDGGVSAPGAAPGEFAAGEANAPACRLAGDARLA